MTQGMLADPRQPTDVNPPEGSICSLGVTELGVRYRSRDLSPVEVTKATLDRIDAINPLINAFISVNHELALSAAKIAEFQFKSGVDLGSLQGIPISLKDNIHARGTITTAASRVLMNAKPDKTDATVVRRLRAGGAVLLGKNNLHEFAFGDPDADSPFGVVQNPRKLGHQTGGSSSGSAAAVAAGLGVLSLGTDTAGSLRGPASLCGVASIKATRGLVPNQGVIPDSPEFDHVGPLGRSVLDVAAGLAGIAGFSEGDAAARRAHVGLTPPAREAAARGMRFGVPRNAEFFVGTENGLEAYARARQALLDAGLHEVPFTAALVFEVTDILHDVLIPPDVWNYHLAEYGDSHSTRQAFSTMGGKIQIDLSVRVFGRKEIAAAVGDGVGNALQRHRCSPPSGESAWRTATWGRHHNDRG